MKLGGVGELLSFVVMFVIVNVVFRLMGKWLWEMLFDLLVLI